MLSRWVVAWAMAAGLAGCTASGTTGGDGGSSGGACLAGSCDACGDCYALCRCSTGSDEATCLSVCGQGTGGAGTGGAGGTGGVGAGGAGAGTSTGGTGGTSAVGALAAGVRITEIALYQGVKVPLMSGGGEVTSRNAPVVANRAGLLRVFYAPDAGWQQREVAARLEIAGAPAQEIVRFLGPNASTDADIMSTFSFDVPAEHLTGGSSYSVSIVERGASGPGGDTSGARWPAQGTQGFMAENAFGAFRVVLVPMVVGGYTPDVSGTRVDQYHRRLRSMFPVESLEITVRQAVSYGGSVSASGTGWSSALNSLLNLRAQDNPDPRVYYFGLITPANSVFSYCGGGCVAGLSGVPQANDSSERGSIGLGFFPSGDSADSPDTMAHELGHALGRQHSPCDTSDAPPGFPHAGGGIGVWGWNDDLNQLLSPATHKDIMGYCDPGWISDYTFDRIFDRIAYVNANGDTWGALDPERLPGTFRVAIVEPDGSAHWAETVERRAPALGELREVTLVDAAGAPLRTARGVWYPSADVAGGRLFVRVTELGDAPIPAHGLRAETVSHTTLVLGAP